MQPRMMAIQKGGSEMAEGELNRPENLDDGLEEEVEDVEDPTFVDEDDSELVDPPIIRTLIWSRDRDGDGSGWRRRRGWGYPGDTTIGHTESQRAVVWARSQGGGPSGDEQGGGPSDGEQAGGGLGRAHHAEARPHLQPRSWITTIDAGAPGAAAATPWYLKLLG